MAPPKKRWVGFIFSAEINAAGQFAYDQKISAADAFIFKRR